MMAEWSRKATIEQKAAFRKLFGSPGIVTVPGGGLAASLAAV